MSSRMWVQNIIPVLVDEAAQLCHTAMFGNHGQNCCAGSRTFVHESVHKEFVKRAVELAQTRTVGDPFDENTLQGPQVRFVICSKQGT